MMWAELKSDISPNFVLFCRNICQAKWLWGDEGISMGRGNVVVGLWGLRCAWWWGKRWNFMWAIHVAEVFWALWKVFAMLPEEMGCYYGCKLFNLMFCSVIKIHEVQYEGATAEKPCQWEKLQPHLSLFMVLEWVEKGTGGAYWLM